MWYRVIIYSRLVSGFDGANVGLKLGHNNGKLLGYPDKTIDDGEEGGILTQQTFQHKKYSMVTRRLSTKHGCRLEVPPSRRSHMVRRKYANQGP
jgi:hypothetical protein